MRICLVSERLSPPYDEGIKNYAWQVSQSLRREHETLTLTAFCADGDVLDGSIRQVATNRLFYSGEMRRAVRQFRPELVLYVPTACATLASFCRTRILQRMAGSAPVVMIALQWRPITGGARRLMPFVRPRLILTQSQATSSSLAEIGCLTASLPAQVDTERFAPVDSDAKTALKQAYGFSIDLPIVLHVGHLNAGRNVQAMIDIQQGLPVQTLVVGSSSTPHEAALVERLQAAGVTVIDHYLENVAEVYQLADCYLFPVQAAMSAIDLPLSVLEAMACNLPVVTTRHAGLVTLFDEMPGLVYAASIDEMVAGVRRCLDSDSSDMRSVVMPLSANTSVTRLLDTIRLALGAWRS